MTSRIHRSMKLPIRDGLSATELWLAEDRGLIKCWELGREWRDSKADLAAKASLGELPTLNWKGGVEKTLKIPVKYGSFRYLATWQGLRGEDLEIDLTSETGLTCTRTGMNVIYTPDTNKYSAEQ